MAQGWPANEGGLNGQLRTKPTISPKATRQSNASLSGNGALQHLSTQHSHRHGKIRSDTHEGEWFHSRNFTYFTHNEPAISSRHLRRHALLFSSPSIVPMHSSCNVLDEDPSTLCFFHPSLLTSSRPDPQPEELGSFALLVGYASALGIVLAAVTPGVLWGYELVSGCEEMAVWWGCSSPPTR